MWGFDKLNRRRGRLNQRRGALVLVGALLLAGMPATGSAEEAPDLGCDEGLIEKTLINGAAWRMCARIHSIKGLVLEKIEFKPASGDHEYSGYKRILDQIYLAQLNVPYDTGTAAYNDIPDYGFGGRFLVEQVPEVCNGETMDVDQAVLDGDQLVERTMPGICVDEVDTGLTTHSQESQLGGGPRFADQGTALEVSSLSKVSWYEYQQKVTFDDLGTIDVGLGATGDLAPGTAYYTTDSRLGWPLGPPVDGTQHHGASHRHNAIYRVDFGIDQGERQIVEQWDYDSPRSRAYPVVEGTATERTKAFSSVPDVDHDELTWWRVVNPDSLNNDGHPRSYEIVNHNPTDTFSPETSPLVSFTNDVDCQEYATNNLNPGCPRQSILDYVAGDEAPLTDPVAWVNVGFHHIDRNEDQSPMPVHWQSFQLTPRDFFAQSPSTPAERQCINGFESGIDSKNRPCIATNRLRPEIITDDEAIGPGSTLEATPGAWYINRTTWDYSYLWFRDGEPLVTLDDEGTELAATGPHYVVTEADRGSSLTVKVTASRAGFGSGTAESAAVRIPGAPKTTPSMRMTVSRGTYGGSGTAVVDLPDQATGTVTLSIAGRSLGTKRLHHGRARFPLARTTPPGRWALRATYPGSATYRPAQATARYAVTKGTASKPTLRFAKKPTRRKKGKASVAIRTRAGLGKATGRVTVTLKKGKKTKRVHGKVRRGRAVVRLPKLARGRYKVRVTYAGDRHYKRATSRTYKMKIRR